MSYKLPVYTDEELAKATSYPPLECDKYFFRVVDHQEGTAKNNNHMEKLTLDVYHRGKNNKPMKCFHTFFIESDTTKPNHMYDIKKIKDFLDCIGVEYTADSFNRVINREGSAAFLVDTYIKNGEEREKFVIPDNGFREDCPTPEIPAPMKRQPIGSTEGFDDDIPF